MCRHKLMPDDDYEGGHIVGAIHSPSSTFLDSVNDLLTKVKDCMYPNLTPDDHVVFHCALSQQRYVLMLT